jgi:hypothetical protein
MNDSFHLDARWEAGGHELGLATAYYPLGLSPWLPWFWPIPSITVSWRRLPDVVLPVESWADTSNVIQLQPERERR